MANPRYNTQVANRRGAMNGGRMKKMGGGMMMRKRPMMNKGGRTKKMTEAQKKAAKKTGKIVEKAISFGFPFTKNPELFKELPLKPGMKGFPKNFKPIKEKK